MADNPEGLTFVLPVFDQEKAVGKAVSSWVPVLNSLGRPYQLLIVDDGSGDGTKAQADVIATRNKRVHVLAHPEHRGYGACLRTALESATQPILFYTSVDPGWHPSDLQRMLKSLDVRDEYTGKQVEVVNGHRRGTALVGARKWFSRFYRLFVRLAFGYWPDHSKGWLGKAEGRFWWRCRVLFGLRVGDINCKFKLFRRSVFDRMVIQSDGEFVHAELLAKANFLGCMMDEVVLAARHVPGPLPDTRKEMWRVFNDPKFRSPVPTPGLPDGKPPTDIPPDSPPKSPAPEPVATPS
jgi:glycosyltransferase involved in cell wall biosynthesis